VIPTMLDTATQGEVHSYGNNYKALNLIITALGRNVYVVSCTRKLLKLFGLNCAIHMRALLRLSLLIMILIIDSTKHSLRNLVNLLMIAFLGLSPL
jgi:hypothetical protein